jgi:site-specific recombinase XerD
VVAAHHISVRENTVSPHALRHSTAMHLLQSAVDLTVIALWLGHGSTETHPYVAANLAINEEALSKLDEVPLPEAHFRPADKLLQFL